MDSSILPVGNGADVSSIQPILVDFNPMIVPFKDISVSAQARPARPSLLQGSL